MSQSLTTVVFDLGGVLIDWNPRYLYRKLFQDDEQAMETFLATVCTEAWHSNHDLGISFVENARTLIEQHPDQADLIRIWGERFDEMFKGPIEESVQILTELHSLRKPLYVLSNWPLDDFPKAEIRFPFLNMFSGKIVSGYERIAKPNLGIYRLLTQRYGVVPENAVFIDDREPNVAAAQSLGFTGITFTSAPHLRKRLHELNLLN